MTKPAQTRSSASRSVNLERRAEIGAERRARSRSAIFVSAFKLLGTEEGGSARIEDICREAGVARGTFYNHFRDLEELRFELLEELTREFDQAVHLTFSQFDGPVEQAAAAVRYYLHAARKNQAWGWAMINSGIRGHIFGKTVWNNSLRTIRDGMDAGHFRLKSAETGRDILMGVVMAATISIVQNVTAPSYPEDMAEHVMLAFGLDAERARASIRKPLPELPPIAHEIIVIASMPALGGAGIQAEDA